MIDHGFSKNFLTTFFTVFTVILLAFTVMVIFRGRENGEPLNCERITIEGKYSLDGEKTFFDLAGSYPPLVTNSTQMVVEGHIQQRIEDKTPVYLFVSGVLVKIYINGELVFDHPEFSQQTWVSFVPGSIYEDDLIRIELTSDENYALNVHFRQFMNRMYATERYDLIRVIISYYGLHLIACGVIIMMGVSILIYRECFKGIKDYNPVGLRSCGMMMIFGGLTCYLDYNYITLVSRNLYFLRFMDFLTQAMVVIFVASYLKRYIVKEDTKNKFDLIVLLMILFLSIYMVRYIVTDSIKNIDWLFIVFVICVIVMLFVELRAVYIEDALMPKKNRMAFDSMLLLVLGFIIEMLYFVLTGTYMVRIIETCLLIFSIMQYYLLVSTNVENYYKAQQTRELENELIQNKIKLMLGQIQPHFLYNAIGTIRALCTKRPEEARNALDYFARYLRANMDSISEEGCIPFEKELDHVKSYLYIEKLRFGEMLNVTYDIQTVDFSCPPLMLQTIVENAVKHGLLPKKEGGTINIITLETSNCYEIKVVDDGVGFDTSKPLEEGRSHIGVDNTRQRLMALCEGTLSIGSRIGVGTTITMVIPKRNRFGGGNESNFG